MRKEFVKDLKVKDETYCVFEMEQHIFLKLKLSMNTQIRVQ